MQKFGFHHLALKVANYDEVVKFYTEGLGFACLRTFPNGSGEGCMLDMGDGAILEIFPDATATQPQEGGFVHFALSTEDVDGAYQTALAAGATTHMEPCDLTIASNPAMPVRIAFVKGLAGELVEFFHTK